MKAFAIWEDIFCFQPVPPFFPNSHKWPVPVRFCPPRSSSKQRKEKDRFPYWCACWGVSFCFSSVVQDPQLLSGWMPIRAQSEGAGSDDQFFQNSHVPLWRRVSHERSLPLRPFGTRTKLVRYPAGSRQRISFPRTNEAERPHNARERGGEAQASETETRVDQDVDDRHSGGQWGGSAP